MLTNTKDTWMRTKPMERKLFYVCKATDTVKDLPWTKNRAKSVSPLFYTTRRQALVDLKEIITERINVGVCQIFEIERELAKNANT